MDAPRATFFAEDSPRRRLLLALALYGVATAVYFLFADRATLVEHTPYNHFALQAEAWLKGHVHLEGGPPAYAGNNDFARYRGEWYVVFPPFPALLLVPLVALAGSAARVQDGQLFLWLAGIAPAVLFLALEKLRRAGRSRRTERDDLVLAALFAFGTVYFFTAEQGTVWYAAHVVGTALATLYLHAALDAERPVLAGLLLGLGFLTRTPLVFAAPLFIAEAVRVCTPASVPSPAGRGCLAALGAQWRALDRRRCAGLLGAFLAPCAGLVALALAYNALRFGSVGDFGYAHLEIAWQARVHKWGLFHYHYLGRNLGVVLTSLPYLPPPGAASPAPFQINGHGLALWVTSPFLLWLVWPRDTRAPHLGLWLTVAAVAAPSLFYQNSGWVQFGYRFANDFAPFLFALLALGGRRLGPAFITLGVLAVAINAFGAATFGREAYRDYYFIERTQRVLYQPD